MQNLLNGLRAAGEPTRLRLLAILAEHELTVTELTRILGQSQPRVSRHLKLLCEAGLLERIQEGTWAFFRLADTGAGAELARTLLRLLPDGDEVLERDRERLADIEREHAAAAATYFSEVAERWDCTRSLYVPEAEVEATLLELAGNRRVVDLLDLGTGTGRMLQVFGHRAERGLGIDSSQAMLAVARSNLAQQRLNHCQVRRGDIYQLTLPPGSVDLITIHHVLHFLDDPGAAVAEAARVLRAEGRIMIVDFAPHQMEFLRTEYAHRRLGFADDEVKGWCEAAGLVEFEARHLRREPDADSDRLTVSIWTASQNEAATAHYKLEVA